jgi:hypothetical protein
MVLKFYWDEKNENCYKFVFLIIMVSLEITLLILTIYNKIIII